MHGRRLFCVGFGIPLSVAMHSSALLCTHVLSSLTPDTPAESSACSTMLKERATRTPHHRWLASTIRSLRTITPPAALVNRVVTHDCQAAKCLNSVIVLCVDLLLLR
jgi:hypothetical protein